MPYRLFQSIFLGSLAAVVLFAASKGAWKNKDFKDWTDEDAQAIMTDSPWAKTIPMPAGGRPETVVVESVNNGAAPPTASLGNGANNSAGTNMTGGSNPANSGSPDQNGSHPQSTAQLPSAMAPSAGAPESPGTVRIIWASSTPVRLAVLRLHSGPNTPLEADVENATKPRKNYVIAVSGLPAPDRDFDAQSAARKAFLSAKNSNRAVASEVLYRKIGNSDVYFFHFDRTALTLSGTGEVEFRMQLGKVEVKKKFDLGEMLYQGKTAL